MGFRFNVRVRELGLKAWGSGSRVQGVGFGARGLEIGVQGYGALKRHQGYK